MRSRLALIAVAAVLGLSACTADAPGSTATATPTAASRAPAAVSASPAASSTTAPTRTPTSTGTASPTPTPAPTGTSTPTATATSASTPTPGGAAGALDLRAQRLSIPAMGLDAPVQGSQIVPDTSVPLPGCPVPPPGQTTLTVPNYGLATPEETIEGLENKAWIFGHSRWLGQPGLLFGLAGLQRGDEVFVDGVDRASARAVSRLRYVVDRFYLADIDSGGALVESVTPEQPLVILQTSVREDGHGKPWILDRQQVMAKSENVVQGSLDDPCKYLLLFVFARAS